MRAQDLAQKIEQYGEPWLTYGLLLAAIVLVALALTAPAWMKPVILAWILMP